MPAAPYSHHDPITARYLADLTADQRAQLSADPELRTAFEAGLEPFLPKPVGVSWSMPGERWVPVRPVFENALRKVRWGRAREIAAKVAA